MLYQFSIEFSLISIKHLADARFYIAWDSGQLQGPAVVMGKNGDKLEFSYSSVSEAVLFPCYCDSFTSYV